MRRKPAVTMLAAVLLVALSGCIGALAPTESIAASEPNGDDTMTAGEFRWNLENPPDENGIALDVVEFTRSGDTLTVTYEEQASAGGVEQVAVVAQTYRSYVRYNDAPGTRLNIVIQDQYGDTVGELHVEAEWAERANQGEFSVEDYVARILQTGALE